MNLRTNHYLINCKNRQVESHISNSLSLIYNNVTSSLDSSLQQLDKKRCSTSCAIDKQNFHPNRQKLYFKIDSSIQDQIFLRSVIYDQNRLLKNNKTSNYNKNSKRLVSMHQISPKKLNYYIQKQIPKKRVIGYMSENIYTNNNNRIDNCRQSKAIDKSTTTVDSLDYSIHSVDIISYVPRVPRLLLKKIVSSNQCDKKYQSNNFIIIKPEAKQQEEVERYNESQVKILKQQLSILQQQQNHLQAQHTFQATYFNLKKRQFINSRRQWKHKIIQRQQQIQELKQAIAMNKNK